MIFHHVLVSIALQVYISFGVLQRSLFLHYKSRGSYKLSMPCKKRRMTNRCPLCMRFTSATWHDCPQTNTEAAFVSDELPEIETNDAQNSPPFEHSSEVIDAAEITFCNNCLRQPTDKYTFNVTPVERNLLKLQKYGCKDNWGLVVNICETHCKPYLTEDNRHWSVVWPSVLATFFIKLDKHARLLWTMLPHTLRQHYTITLACEFSQVSITDDCEFADVTQEMKQFEKYHMSLNIENVIDTIDKTSFPHIVCPCGSWLFLDECYLLPLHFFLGHINSHFHSFSCGVGLFQGMRRDFMQKTLFLQTFHASASIVIDEKDGLCMLVCDLHKNGLPLKYVHAPIHPINGFVSSVHADRLATVVPSLRVARSAKTKHSSYEYRLLKMTGDYNGTHVMSLSQRRNMRLQHWETVHYASEMLAIQMRPDMSAFAKQLMIDGVVSREYFIQLTDATYIAKNCTLPSSTHLARCLKGATTVDLPSAVRLKEVTLSEHFADIPNGILKALVFNHPLDDFAHGEKPFYIPAFKNRIFKLVYYCVVMSPELWHNMITKYHSPFHCSLLKLLTIPLQHCGFIKGVTHRHHRQSFFSKETETESLLGNVVSPQTTLQNKFVEVMRSCGVICFNSGEDLNVQGIPTSCDNLLQHTIVMLVNNCNSRNEQMLSDTMNIGDKQLELRMIISLRLHCFVARYGGKQISWWHVHRDGEPIALNDCTFFDFLKDHELHNRWTFALYHEMSGGMLEQLKSRYLHFLSGQSQFTCAEHSYPLTSEIKCSGKSCCFEHEIETCQRKAYFSCPVDDCKVCVCRKHFKENCSEKHKLFSKEIINSIPRDESSDDSFTDEEDVAVPIIDDEIREMSEVEDLELGFLTDAGFVETEGLNSAIDSTDAGAIAQTIQSNNSRINMNLLLAADVQPLIRRQGLVKATVATKRFMQNIVSTNNRSVPISSLQAMICPTAYFCSTDIGSYPGAIPSVLMKSREQNAALGFDGIEEHAKVLLRNHSLAASNNQYNQSLLFDIIVNRKLSTCHTHRLLRGGLTELTNTSVDDKTSHIWDISQSQRHVRELSACFRENPPKLFVTLTCNMREHFGVRNVFNVLDQNYWKQHFPSLESDRFLDCAKELRESVMQSSLVLLTRCWKRALRYLLHIITKNHVLGTVNNYWGTHEFQPGRGNVSHFHLLLDCVEDREQLAQTVACKLRRFNSEIKQFAVAHSSILKNEEEVEAMYRLMAQIQIHDCEKGQRSCHKKVDNHGTPICRVRRYPSNIIDPVREEFNQTHTDEVWELLEKIGFAVKTAKGHLPEYEACGPLVRDKILYPADDGEHVVPTNVALSCITRSNSNVLVTTPHMCASYTATYLTLKEKSMVQITSGQSHKELTATVDKIQHDKLPAVQIRLKREAKERRKRLKE